MAAHGSVLLETVVSTVVILFCGEFMPKSIVKKTPNFYYEFFSPVIYFFYLLLYPVAILTTWLSYAILRLFGRRSDGRSIAYTFNREDLVNLVDGDDVELQHDDEEEIKF